MSNLGDIELLEFNLKILGRKSRKTILLSVGPTEDKRLLLPIIKEVTKSFNINIYATTSTNSYLKKNGVHTTHLFKVSQERSPNIKEFLKQNAFDLVINIRRGQDYDESSDGSLIRSFCVDNGIPLITDSQVAILSLQNMLKKRTNHQKTQSWDLKSHFLDLVGKNGGYACYHSHLDKAYLISPENLKLSMVDMQKKWELYKYLKENYTHSDLVKRMEMGLEIMISQGITHCRTFVDADETVKLLPMNAALEVKEKYKDRITLEIAVQPLHGVIDPDSRKYFVEACEFADIVGGLPSRDRPNPESHLDFIMDLAKDLDRRLDVHIDQENNPDENETELIARKTIEHGLEGKVNSVHSISLAAKEDREQNRIIRIMKDANLSVTICPSAALSMKPLPKVAPIHNSMAPFVKLLENEIPLYIGIDNIHDLFMPINDGDMWSECRMLMEASRFYDLETVAKIVCDKSGFE